MDSTRFSGRTALITGGTNGFGRATAELLVAGGARVMVTGRTATSLEVTRATLGESAVVVASDAASLSDTAALADRARADLGELDLLFVNAGIPRSASLAETDEAVYDEVFATNTKGAYFTRIWVDFRLNQDGVWTASPIVDRMWPALPLGQAVQRRIPTVGS